MSPKDYRLLAIPLHYGIPRLSEPGTGGRNDQ